MGQVGQKQPDMPIAEIVPMSRSGLETFHRTSRKLDFIGPLESLLSEFCRGNIADRDRAQEESAIQSHLAEHREETST